LGEILIKKLGLEERINFYQFWTTCIKGLAKCNSSVMRADQYIVMVSRIIAIKRSCVSLSVQKKDKYRDKIAN